MVGALDASLVLENGAARGFTGVVAGASSSVDGTSKTSRSEWFDTFVVVVAFLAVVLMIFWATMLGAAGVVARDLVLGFVLGFVLCFVEVRIAVWDLAHAGFCVV